MCGIVGYVGKNKAMPILIDGLKRLEYRGYDSAGVAVVEEGRVSSVKAVGKVEQLELKTEKLKSKGHIGIAHTRWATHGKPSVSNSHPHADCKKDVFVVHNGIIENYQKLKEWLKKKKHKFSS
jgi:glucosamine--fructose-6-phosphate aminotransferase (isomerizing)